MGLVRKPSNGLPLIWRIDKQLNVANVPHGIPQGSILGPLLFIVFINDLPFHVTSSTIDLYADDTTLTSCASYSSIDRLEQNLNFSVAEIAEWAAFNKLPINESKTKAILITGKRLPSKINYEMALTINGTIYEWNYIWIRNKDIEPLMLLPKLFNFLFILPSLDR